MITKGKVMAKSNKSAEGVTPEATENKAAKKSAKKNQSWYQHPIVSGIIGIGMLLAVISIVYSTATIVLGTEGITPLIMITPQVVLALVILIKQFIKK